ncbi:hypothetical protein Tco_0332753 [Tanacetum coccineum]
MILKLSSNGSTCLAYTCCVTGEALLGQSGLSTGCYAYCKCLSKVSKERYGKQVLKACDCIGASRATSSELKCAKAMMYKRDRRCVDSTRDVFSSIWTSPSEIQKFSESVSTTRMEQVYDGPIRVMLLVLEEIMQGGRQGYNCQGEGHMARQLQLELEEARTLAMLKKRPNTEDLDAYYSDCDDVSNAKAVLMANLSNYGSDVIT